MDSQASGSEALWGCARHARVGRTCCQTAEVFVTDGDRERIAGATGRTDFWEYRVPEDPAYLGHADDPDWLLGAFRSDGSRPVLRRRGQGDCTYLGGNGCTLALEIRPLVCRLFPFSYTAAGLGEVAVDACPREAVGPGSTVLEMLDMNPTDAERWRRQLYAELREGARRCTSV